VLVIRNPLAHTRLFCAEMSDKRWKTYLLALTAASSPWDRGLGGQSFSSLGTAVMLNSGMLGNALQGSGGPVAAGRALVVT